LNSTGSRSRSRPSAETWRLRSGGKHRIGWPSEDRADVAGFSFAMRLPTDSMARGWMSSRKRRFRRTDTPGGAYRKPARTGADILTCPDIEQIHYTINPELLISVRILEDGEITGVGCAGGPLPTRLRSLGRSGPADVCLAPQAREKAAVQGQKRDPLIMPPALQDLLPVATESVPVPALPFYATSLE
jgi:hypothetical protein